MRSIKKWLFLPTICYLLTILLCGCAALPGKDSSAPDLKPKTILKFSDLPVPAAFKMLPQGSYCFESAGIRAGLLRYKGKATLDQLINFYREQMPMHNWSLINTTQYGDCIMNFERDQESCIITISSRGSSSVISMAIGPKSQTLPKKLKQPVK